MSDIVEFLEARIAEDEAAAKQDLDLLPVISYERERIRLPLALVTGMHDPDRVLAECKAKRELIETLRWLEDQHEWAFFDPCVEGAIPKMLSTLAQPYSDHPDFDASWMARGTT
jgi:hypothetical protein